MEKITFIMAVYNTRHEWIKRAVDSIIEQTDPAWKMILVDDGSKEETADYCDQLSMSDQRIVVHHQENAGLSTSRNYGMDHADTPWVTFIDADDWIEPTYVEEIFHVLDRNSELEVLLLGHDDIYESKTVNQLWGTEEYHKFCDLDKPGIQMALLQEPEGLVKYPMFFGAQWKMVYSLDFLNKYQIRNDPKVLKAQDSVFNLYVTEYAADIGYYNRCLYHYFHNDESVTGTKFNKNTSRIIDLLTAYKEFIDNTGKSKDERYLLAYKKIMLLQFELMLRVSFLNEYNPDSKAEKIRGIKNIVENNPYNAFLAETDGTGLSLYRKVLLYIMQSHKYNLLICIFNVKTFLK